MRNPAGAGGEETTMRLTAAALVAAVLAALCACAPSATTTAAPPTPTTQASPSSSSSSSSTTGDATDLAETVYLRTLSRRGIGTGDSERELRRARATCSLLAEGQTFRQVVEALEANGFTAGDAGFIVGAAVPAFCPAQQSKLQ